MGKLLKVIGIAIGGVVALVIVAAVIAALVIDPNDYKPRIEAAVERQTGRSLDIEGELGLSFFPWLGIDIGAVRLGNAEGFGEQPFAEVGAAQARVKVLPLLWGEVEVGTLVLQGLRLSLAVDQRGRSNWADLAGGAEPAAPAKAPPDQPGQDKGPPLAALAAIGGVDVRDARLTYTDRQAGKSYRIEGLALETGPLRPGERFAVSFETGFASSAPELDGRVTLDGRVRFDAALESFEVSKLSVRTHAEGEPLPAPLDAELDAELIEVDLSEQTFNADGAALSLARMTVRTSLTGEKILDAPKIRGDVEIARFSPREMLKALGQPVPETSDPEALTRASAKFGLSATTDSVSLSDLTLALDETTAKGSLGAKNLAGHPALRFDLDVDRLDADRYLPPRKQGEAAGATPGAAAAGATTLPVEPLRAFDLDGKLHVGELRAAQIRSTDVNVEVSANKGLIRVHPASAKLYEGTYQGDITLDARGAAPKLSMDEKLQGIRVQGLVMDLVGEKRLSGTANASAKLTTRGPTVEAMRANLDGNVAFSLNDGAFEGVDVAHRIRAAQARYEGRAAPEAPDPERTRIAEAQGSAEINDGVATNRDLEVRSPLFRANGRGTVNLVKQALDYKLDVTLEGSATDQLGGDLERLKGATIPLRISGPFASPSVKVDVASVLKQEAERRVKEKVKKKLQEELGGGKDGEQPAEPEKQIERKLEDKLKRGLEGLFN